MKASLLFFGALISTSLSVAAPDIRYFDAVTLHTVSEIAQKCPSEFSKMLSDNKILTNLSSQDSSNPINNRSVIVTVLQSGYLPSPMSGTVGPRVISNLIMTQVEKPGPHPMDGGEYYDIQCEYSLVK